MAPCACSCHLLFKWTTVPRTQLRGSCSGSRHTSSSTRTLAQETSPSGRKEKGKLPKRRHHHQDIHLDLDKEREHIKAQVKNDYIDTEKMDDNSLLMQYFRSVLPKSCHFETNFNQLYLSVWFPRYLREGIKNCFLKQFLNQ